MGLARENGRAWTSCRPPALLQTPLRKSSRLRGLPFFLDVPCASATQPACSGTLGVHYMSLRASASPPAQG